MREIALFFGHELPVGLVAAPAGREGREIKARIFAEHGERRKWRQVDAPGEWAVALMHRPFRDPIMIEHAGVWLDMDGGGVLHTDDPHGVVFDSLVELTGARRWVPIFLVPV